VVKIIGETVLSPNGKWVLDLYCGMGNLSLPMALKNGRVTGIDSAPVSIQTARQNAVANGIHSATFICADAGDFLREHLQGRSPSCDILVLDPPRTGAREIAELLSTSAKCPETIIYVSCDPMTLARDLRILIGSAYDILSVTPIDMFPQTFHIETVTVLRRKTDKNI
jgi:23S rRNA (uracil1939-C5)-methyltransferase